MLKERKSDARKNVFVILYQEGSTCLLSNDETGKLKSFRMQKHFLSRFIITSQFHFLWRKHSREQSDKKKKLTDSVWILKNYKHCIKNHTKSS